MQNLRLVRGYLQIFVVVLGSCSWVLAEAQATKLTMIRENAKNFFVPKSDQNFNIIQFKQLNQLNAGEFNAIVQSEPTRAKSTVNTTLGFYQAIQLALQKHPEIGEAVANLATQNASIDVVRANYFPQISGGISSGDFTSGERGRQVLELNASQLLYDFGKVKSEIAVEKADLILQQASLLLSIDDIASQVALAISNVLRYQELCHIAQQQIEGLQRIAEIATLRANAGISTQADPVQAQSFVESAESTLIEQQTELARYQLNLTTLLGIDTQHVQWQIPNNLVKQSQLYSPPIFTEIPEIIAAQADIELAKAQKTQVDKSRYPTINVVGSLSQAVNGVNPNNNKDNGRYSSIMLEANSNFYRGGAIAAQSRAANYAEQAARSRLRNAYLNVNEQIQLTQDQIQHKQRQISILAARQLTTVRTKELYQEQYKLGTRSVVDLLNAEQAIHTSNMSLVSARYDIYSNLVQYIAATGRTRSVYGLNNMSIQGFEIQQ